MSALHLPTAPARDAARRGAPVRHLRLVEPQPRTLAPSGPLQAWRRRIGLLLAVSLLVVLAVDLVAGGEAVSPVTVPVAAETVVVEPGQTLWDIAQVHAPADVPTGVYVDQLIVLNGLDGVAIDPWQVLRLPNG